LVEWLRELTEATHPIWQWAVIFFAGAIPFIESYFGATLGVVAGMSPPVAIAAAVVGNVVAMILLVALAGRVRGATNADRDELTPRKQKFKVAFDRYGVAGVSLFGQTILPSQITSMAMIAFGASKKAVILWQTVSITVWGTAFGVLTALGVSAFLPLAA
jgi:uncharacterized membrane protein